MGAAPRPRVFSVRGRWTARELVEGRAVVPGLAEPELARNGLSAKADDRAGFHKLVEVEEEI